MSNHESDTRINTESRELFDRARKQVESLPEWRLSYDVQSEMQKLTRQQSTTVPDRRSGQ